MTTQAIIQNQTYFQPETKPKPTKEPWNKGKLMGQKPPLKLKEV